jgi:hypothetical protein
MWKGLEKKTRNENEGIFLLFLKLLLLTAPHPRFSGSILLVEELAQGFGSKRSGWFC